MPGWFLTRCRVPGDLAAVTTVHRDAEVLPRSVGADPEAVERVWEAVLALYRTGVHPAIQLCVRRRGAVLLQRAIGHAVGNGPEDPPDAPKRLATPETPFTIFSASKAVTAMVIHLLDQHRLLHLDDPVCEYIPEFGKRGKEWVTIRHVLTHRAGLPTLPGSAMDLDLLSHPDHILDLLCEAPLRWRPGRRLAYHTITGGFLLGEVVRRVTGRDIRQVLAREIARPLGLRGFGYGVRRDRVRAVARNYFTGFAPFPPFSTILHRALGIDVREAVALSNDPRFLTGIIPSANVVATADELSRFYQLLLNGGELDGQRIFDRRTVRRATSEQAYLEFDLTLGVPIRYGMGFMLGAKRLSFYGPDTDRAFGHIGLTNIVAWADPERQVAAALMTSGKPIVHPGLAHLYRIMVRIGEACPKERQAMRPGAPLTRPRASRPPRSIPASRRIGVRRRTPPGPGRD